MKILSKFIVILILGCSFPVFAQTFSPNIIVDPITPLQTGKSLPIIDLNSLGDIGISWATGYPNHSEVYFIKSYNGGQSFDTIRVVDYLNYITRPMLLYSYKFDSFNNPLVCYGYMHEWGGGVEHFIKKSLNGGINFAFGNHHFLTGLPCLNFKFVNDTMGLLSHESSQPIGQIIIKKTVDGGLTFVDSALVPDISNSSVIPFHISTLQCENGDILCFWTEQDSGTANTNVYYSRSIDNGTSFSNPICLDTMYDRSNGIFASSCQNNVYIVYSASYNTGERYILFKKSVDYGFNYHSSKILHDYSTNNPGVPPSPEIRINPNVGLAVVWGQELDQYDYVYFAFSNDFGETFDSTITLPQTGSRYRDYQSMAISDSGDVYIVSVFGWYWQPNNFIILNKTKLPILTPIKHSNSPKINDYKLYPNYPNPFNNETTISFYLPKKIDTDLKIYDINGRLIKILISGDLRSGHYGVTWNGLNSEGNQVSSGLYFYLLINKDYSESKKLVYMK